MQQQGQLKHRALVTGLVEVWNGKPHGETRSTRERIYDYLRVFRAVVGRPATVREIRDGLRLHSTGQVSHHLRMLIREGRVEQRPGGWVRAEPLLPPPAAVGASGKVGAN